MPATLVPSFSARLVRRQRGRRWPVAAVCGVALAVFPLSRLLPESLRWSAYLLDLSFFPIIFLPLVRRALASRKDAVTLAVYRDAIAANGFCLVRRRDIIDAYVEPAYPETATVSRFGRARVPGRSTIVIVRTRKRALRIELDREEKANAFLAAMGCGARQAAVSFRSRLVGARLWAVLSFFGVAAPAVGLTVAFVRHDAKLVVTIPVGLALSLVLCLTISLASLLTTTTAIIGPDFVQVPRLLGSPHRIPLAWIHGAHDNDKNAVILVLQNGTEIRIRDDSADNRGAILARFDALWYSPAQ